METIHYISDFRFFSGKKVSPKYGNVLNALREHIRYIARKSKGVITFNLNVKDWIEKGKREIAKRWDSRIALKFVIALPLEVNEKNVERTAEILKEFIAKNLDVDKKDIGIAIHLHKGLSGNYNPHAHILVFPRRRNGKKLRLNKKDLSEFHRRWQKLLREIGYQIRKDDEPLPHLGSKLYYDKEAQELYRLRFEIRDLEKRLEINHRGTANAVRGKEEGEEFKVENSFLMRIKEMVGGKDFAEKQKNALLTHFSRLGYKENDKLAVVLINHRENKTLQRVMSVREILNDKTLRYLRAMNSKGFSVYASINTLKPSATRRRKEDFNEKQRRIYLDLDSKEVSPKKLIAKLYQYLSLKQLPQPTHIVKSSKGNYQVYWVLDESVNWQELERVMEKMNNDLGLDHTQDVSRVFRLPYFRNKKPEKDDLVLNINALNVFMNGEKVDEIKATGETVKFDAFKRLIEPIKLPEPKSLRVKDDFSKGIKEKWDEYDRTFELKRLKNRVKELMSQGYSLEVARYRALFENYMEKVFSDLFAKGFIAEHIDLLMLAFERNKNKSPSEVDLAIVGLIYSRYKGTPSRNILMALKNLIVDLARLRDKRSNLQQAIDYAERTIAKAKSYWDKKRLEELKRELRYNGNDKGLDLKI